MKCRFSDGSRSTVVSSNRNGVACLGAILQDIPDISLFAICTEDTSGNRLWTTLWYRKPNRSIHLIDGLRGLAYVLSSDIAHFRLAVLSRLDRSDDVEREYGLSFFGDPGGL
jgi:hypothetical protein